MGEDIEIVNAAARLGHHGRYGVAPNRIVIGLFMQGGCVEVAVDFDQEKLVGRLLFLIQFEADHTGLSAAFARVVDSGFAEGVDVGGEDFDKDMNNLHTVPISTAKPAKAERARKRRDLAGIGPSLEANLRSLGVETVEQLARCDGRVLYDRLCEKTGTRQDPCVLDTFRCAVAQAGNPHLSSEQRNWWWWSQQRKQGKLS